MVSCSEKHTYRGIEGSLGINFFQDHYTFSLEQDVVFLYS